MDWNRVDGNWKQMKGKGKWGKLTDDDLDRIAGKRDQLEGKIQERYGIEKDRVRHDVDDWYGMQGWQVGAGSRKRRGLLAAAPFSLATRRRDGARAHANLGDQS